MNLCKDCIYCFPDKHYINFWTRKKLKGYWDYARCVRPDGISPVNGETLMHRCNCEVERTTKELIGYCGENGKFWKPKP